MSEKQRQQMQQWLKNYYDIINKFNEQIGEWNKLIAYLSEQIAHLDKVIAETRAELSDELHKVFNNLSTSEESWTLLLPSGKTTQIYEKDFDQKKLFQFAEDVRNGKIDSVDILESLKKLNIEMIREELLKKEQVPPYYVLGYDKEFDKRLEETFTTAKTTSKIFDQHIQQLATKLVNHDEERACLVAEKSTFEQKHSERVATRDQAEAKKNNLIKHVDAKKCPLDEVAQIENDANKLKNIQSDIHQTDKALSSINDPKNDLKRATQDLRAGFRKKPKETSNGSNTSQLSRK